MIDLGLKMLVARKLLQIVCRKDHDRSAARAHRAVPQAAAFTGDGGPLHRWFAHAGAIPDEGAVIEGDKLPRTLSKRGKTGTKSRRWCGVAAPLRPETRRERVRCETRFKMRKRPPEIRSLIDLRAPVTQACSWLGRL
jgi:hypothetical protein